MPEFPPEKQLTHDARGHILTNCNVWSPDSQWIVYDTRSDRAGDLFDGQTIEMVHVETGEVRVLYQSRHGACCGVATWHPHENRVVFILGPEHPTPDWQYGASRRQGVLVDVNRPGVAVNLDARDLTPPFTPGALRGGSHVHVFSPDGTKVSFTYQDQVLAERQHLAKNDPWQELDQRNVGVSYLNHPVVVPKTHPRNHDGAAYSVLVTETKNQPDWQYDQISRAYEEGWVGNDAIAFIGDFLTEDGRKVPELYLTYVLNDFSQRSDSPPAGTLQSRPKPWGIPSRRLTYTEDRKYPGLVTSPRHWVRVSPVDRRIAFLMRDDAGVVQLWTLALDEPHETCQPEQITRGPHGIASAFTWSPDGESIAYVIDGSVTKVDIKTGETRRLTPRRTGDDAPRPEACVYSPNGTYVAYVRTVAGSGILWNAQNQIFVVKTQA